MRNVELFEQGLQKDDAEPQCTKCGACVFRCAFLSEFGTPGEIEEKFKTLPHAEWPDPFQCSLCGLCGAVCPEGVKPDELFLDMRRAKAEAGALDLRPYRPVLSYEQVGDSDLFSLIQLPAGGDTVLFPGCALPTSRSKTVRHLFQALQGVIPDVGIALGCCMKPSHDLGRSRYFEERFGRLHDQLTQAGVRRVVTTCPNCQRIFSQYGDSISSITAYELLAESGFTPDTPVDGHAVVHDPCPQRYDTPVQDAVRTLAKRCGFTLEKRAEERDLTRCCGEGGLVKFVRPEFADSWTDQRCRVADGAHVVTSCAGCTNFLGNCMDVDHILDVMFDSRPRFSLMPPLTYVARLMLKRWFKKNVR